jgi:hypothetical protein
MSNPRGGAQACVKMSFVDGPDADKDFGKHVISMRFAAALSGGYTISGKIAAPAYNIIGDTIENQYLKRARREPVKMRFQLLQDVNGQFPETATRTQEVIVTHLQGHGGAPDVGYFEFVAIDPPSWYLNNGDASGGVFKGRVDQVIKQVIQKYAPSVKAEVSKAVGSEEMKWWMMRMDPQTFITHLMSLSAPLTLKKTQYLVGIDGYSIDIKEQASIKSTQRGYYRYMVDKDHDTIKRWQLLADNSTSLSQHKLVTSGMSTLSGEYYDRTTDTKENQVVVSDKTTEAKQTARTKDTQSFSKPGDGKSEVAGATSIISIPELYSAGDIGIPYKEYISAYARGLWLDTIYNLQRLSLTITGHGEWCDSKGLGVDTAFLQWSKGVTDSDSNRYTWLTGSWIIYGFTHFYDRKGWDTVLNCARYDHDANSVKVGGS